MTFAPDTLAIGDAIAAYLAALTYPNTSLVYTLAQVEAIKDVVDRVANGGACCEIYGDKDSSTRRGFGGRIWDPQTWFILSLCALDTVAHARQIYNIRDALVQPFQQHGLGGRQAGGMNACAKLPYQAQQRGAQRFGQFRRGFRTLRLGGHRRLRWCQLRQLVERPPSSGGRDALRKLLERPA